MPNVRSIDSRPHRVESARPAGYGGTGSVTGTTAVQGTPSNTLVSRLVRLHDFDTGAMVRGVWSDASGAYAFDKLAPGDYYVAAFDQTGLFNAVIVDRVTVL